MLKNRISRRSLLAGIGIAGLNGAELAGFPFISRGLASAPIRIGVGACPAAVSPTDAKGTRFGAETALRQIGGRVLGQPVQLIHFEESDAAASMADFRKLVDDHGIAGLIGGSNDTAAVSLTRLVGEARLPFIIHTSMFDDITGALCNRWTYRVPVPLGIQLRALHPYLTEYARRWFILSSADPAGRRSAALARAGMRDAGLTEVGSAVIDNGTNDFGTVIEMIRGSRPETVISTLAGAEIPRFLKAWHAAGMKDKVPFAQVGMADADVWSAGAQAATGIYTKTYHFRNPKNPPEAKEFVAAYGRQFNGEAPSGTAFQAHVAMHALLSSINTAGTPDPKRVVTVLDHFGSPFGDITLRFRDHQMMHRVPILETKTKIRTRYDFWDVEAFAPDEAADLDRFYETANLGTCGPRSA